MAPVTDTTIVARKDGKRKTRSKQKNRRRDTRSEAFKAEKFGAGPGDDVDTASAGMAPTWASKQDRDRCYNCGEAGHWGKDCPKPDRRKLKQLEEQAAGGGGADGGHATRKEKTVAADREASKFAAAEYRAVEVGVDGKPATDDIDRKAMKAKSKSKSTEAEVARPAKKKRNAALGYPSSGELDFTVAALPAMETAGASLQTPGPPSAPSAGKKTKKSWDQKWNRRTKKSKGKISGDAGLWTVFVGQLPEDFADETALRSHFAEYMDVNCTSDENATDASQLLTAVSFLPPRAAKCAFVTEEARELALSEVHKSQLAEFNEARLSLERSPNGNAETQAKEHRERVDGLLKQANGAEVEEDGGLSDEAITTVAKKFALDAQTLEFLYSVSLRTVRQTLADARKVKKEKLADLKRAGERSKFFMGMIKNRIGCAGNNGWGNY